MKSILENYRKNNTVVLFPFSNKPLISNIISGFDLIFLKGVRAGNKKFVGKWGFGMKILKIHIKWKCFNLIFVKVTEKSSNSGD